MDKIGFLGSGNMAEAIINGLLSAKLYKPQNIFASDIRAERIKHFQQEYKIITLDTNEALAQKVDILVLSVKPQQIINALNSIKGSLKKDSLVISIAAGIKTEQITAALGDIPVVRVMPNTPALISQGASALFANQKAKTMLEKVAKIFDAVGKTVVVEDENLIDAVTAVSGSGPAYYFLLTEEIIKAALKLGLTENVAKKLVLQTAKGAAMLAEEADKKGQSPGKLRQNVTSPGGTTEAAMKKFQENKFDDIVAVAIKAACERSKELSKNIE